MKTAKQLGLTTTQHRNIARLTLFVKNSVPPPRFNIKHHHSKAWLPSEATYECDTSACFCGYGPLAGIKPQKGENWYEYAARVFTRGLLNDVWPFLFSEHHKNSKTAAMRRGAWLLTHGLPDTPNSDDLRTWEAPHSFKPNWKAIRKIAFPDNPSSPEQA